MLKKMYKTVDNNNNNILHILVKKNKQNDIKKILDKGLKYDYNKYIINMQNNEGYTPLQLSIKNNKYLITNLLLDYGAKKDVINCLGQKVINQNGGNKKFIGKRYL